MKKLLVLFCLFFSIHCFITAQDSQSRSSSSCGWEAWFPSYCGKTYEAGKNLKVEVRTKNHHRIKYMELYINGDFVGRETGHPYDWGKQGKDKHLRNMHSGTYQMEVKIVDRCGKTKYLKHCEYYVKRRSSGGGDGDCACTREYRPVCGSDGKTYDNPCLAKCAGVSWEYGKCKPSSGDCVCTYEYRPVCGSDGKTYDNSCLAKCAGVSWEYGKCKPSSGSCPFDAWFKHPEKRGHRWYVKLDVDKYRDIKHVELYVNRKFAGKETSYPYDWGKQGKDNYLKNLRHGTYKLHAKIYTKCGHVVDKYHEFRVRGN